MTARPPSNITASVHARLLNRSRETGEDFQFLLHRYTAERFLYRLGVSTYRDRYVLKGAMLYALWGGAIYRPTRDLDFTRYGSNRTDDVLAAFRSICSHPVQDDGLIFDTSTFKTEPIRDDTEYQGVRIRFQAKLGNARIQMQIDIGFANAIEPPATYESYPTLLDGPAPQIRTFPSEAVVAEKFHTMVVLGEINSRLKDFYDLHALASQFSFEGARVARAIEVTFERRRTTIGPALPAARTPRFFADVGRREQWRSYLFRNNLPGVPKDFTVLGKVNISFLVPVWGAIAERSTYDLIWPPGGPWELIGEEG